MNLGILFKNKRLYQLNLPKLIKCKNLGNLILQSFILLPINILHFYKLTISFAPWWLVFIIKSKHQLVFWEGRKWTLDRDEARNLPLGGPILWPKWNCINSYQIMKYIHNTLTHTRSYLELRMFFLFCLKKLVDILWES